MARLKATDQEFEVAPETYTIMFEVTRTQEFKELSGERVLEELAKAFVAMKPSVFFETLRAANCLEYAFPTIDQLIDVPQRPDYHPEGCCYTHTMMVLDAARSLTSGVDVLLSALTHDLGKGITPKEILPKHIGHERSGIRLVEDFCRKYKMSPYASELARFTCENHLKCHTIFEMRPVNIFRLIRASEFEGRPGLLEDFITVCKADSMGKLNEGKYRQGIFLTECKEQIIKAKAQGLVKGTINDQSLERAYSKIVSKIKQKYQLNSM